MPRRPSFAPAGIPETASWAPFVREINRRFGLIGQAFAEYALPFPLTYGPTVNIDATASDYFTLAVLDGLAFTIPFPARLAPGQPLTLEILNSSGGAMGAVTFGTGFLLAGAFVAPANGKRRVYSFRATNVSTLIEVSRSPADL